MAFQGLSSRRDPMIEHSKAAYSYGRLSNIRTITQGKSPRRNTFTYARLGISNNSEVMMADSVGNPGQRHDDRVGATVPPCNTLMAAL